MSLIELHDVYYKYNDGEQDEVPALNGVTLSIEEGEFVVMAGRNGSGKSTCAKLLNGLYTPASGKVLINGIDTADEDRLFDIRKTVGVVFQNPDNQMVATVIEDDIAFGPENIGIPAAEIRERVDWALSAVNMSGHAKGTPFRLSGGQKQRIAIAGVLALKPRVLVMDESTSMLDPEGRQEIMDVLRKLNTEEKITVVLITHYMSEAVAADRIIVLDGGRIVLQGGRELFLMEEQLKGYGLDVPVEASIANELRSRGLELGEVLSIQELEDGLCRLK